MAFGFPPKYSEELIISGINEIELYALAYQTAEKLNWHIEHTSKNGFIIVTSNNPLEAQHEMSLIFEDEKIKIHCISISNLFYDFGRNKKLIQQFIGWLNKQLTSFDPQSLQLKYNSLVDKFNEESSDFLSKDPLERYKIERSFWHAFIPHKDYVYTPIIFYLNLIIFLLVWATGGSFLTTSIEVITFWGANVKSLTLNGEYWRLFASAFLHFGFVHFIMNMYALLNIGMILEPEIGSKKFGFAYLLVLFAASASSVLFNNFVASAGASGAIFGMYGVFIALFSTNVIENKARKAMLSSIVVFVAYTLLNGLKDNSIDHACHFGGFISGLLVGYSISLHKKHFLNNSIRPIILSTCVFIISTYCVLVIFFAVDKSKEYREIMTAVVENEEKALVVYQTSQYTPIDTIKKMLKQEGLVYWEKNLSGLVYIRSLDIPNRLKNKNELFIEYTLSRMEAYNLIYEYLQRDLPINYFLSYEYNQKTRDIVNRIALSE